VTFEFVQRFHSLRLYTEYVYSTVSIFFVIGLYILKIQPLLSLYHPSRMFTEKVNNAK